MNGGLYDEYDKQWAYAELHALSGAVEYPAREQLNRAEQATLALFERDFRAWSTELDDQDHNAFLDQFER